MCSPSGHRIGACCYELSSKYMRHVTHVANIKAAIAVARQFYKFSSPQASRMIHGSLRLVLRLLISSILVNALPLANKPPSTYVNVASTSINLIHSYNSTIFGIPGEVFTSSVISIITASGTLLTFTTSGFPQAHPPTPSSTLFPAPKSSSSFPL